MASFLQMKALDFSFNLFHTSFLSLFDPPSPSFIQQENELQSLPEFLSMGSRRPNPQGTGRNIITKTRNKLYLLKLSKKNLKIDFRILSQLIKAFFGLECLILEKELFCKKKGRGFSLLDEDKALEFPLKSYKGKIDVFSIFDVMVEYVPNDGFAVIGIINEDIYDPEVDNNIIYGRACGDRVAVISDLGFEF